MTIEIFSLEHKDGIPWHNADPPPYRHDCSAQTTAFTNDGIVNRCACGAISFDRDWRHGNSGWLDRNARTPEPPKRSRWQRLLRTGR